MTSRTTNLTWWAATPFASCSPTTSPASSGDRRATDVAIGAVELINGAIAADPHRIGKPLDAPLTGLHSARLMREWRILYGIDDRARTITVRSVRHRRDACLLWNTTHE